MKIFAIIAALIGAAYAGGLGGFGYGHGAEISHASIAKVSYVKTPVVSTSYVKQPVVSYISKPVKTISYVSKPVISVQSAPVISKGYGGIGLGGGLGGYGSGSGWW